MEYTDAGSDDLGGGYDPVDVSFMSGLFDDGVGTDELATSGPAGVGVSSSGSFGGSSGGGQISSPDKVRAYMGKLRTLGFSAPDEGNAFDPGVRAAVRAFQLRIGARAGVPDGLVGPTFFGLVDEEIAAAASSGGAVVVGPDGTLTRVASGGSGDTTIFWVLGGLAAAGGLAAWYFLK